MAIQPAGNVSRTLATLAVRMAATSALGAAAQPGLGDLLAGLSDGGLGAGLMPSIPAQIARTAAEFVGGARDLAEAARPLTGRTGNAFDLRSVTSTQPIAVTGTANAGAEMTEFQIEVDQLAVGQRNAGTALDPQAATNVQAGTNAVAVEIDGQARQVTFQVRPGDTNATALRRFAEAVNAADAGVTAEVVTTNNGRQRIRITQNDTGENATFTIRDVAGNAVAATGVNNVGREAANARFTMDGEALETETNTVQLNGGAVTLQLNEATTEAATVRVGGDVRAQEAAIRRFVDEFNESRRFLAANEVMFNQEAASAMDSAARREGFDLGAAGIARGAGGTLQIDEERLTQALQEDPERVRRAFAGPNGIATGAQSLAERVTTRPLTDFTRGSVASRLLAIGQGAFSRLVGPAAGGLAAMLTPGLLFDQQF